MTFTLSTTTRLAPIVLTTLSLHDALPIWLCSAGSSLLSYRDIDCRKQWAALFLLSGDRERRNSAAHCFLQSMSRSEEHTSELQSRFDLVCRLLLEKKKPNRISTTTTYKAN